MSKLDEAYRHGYGDGRYGFTYLNPQYTADELAEWVRGYKEGLLCRQP